MKEVTDKIKCLYYIKDTRTDKIIYIGQTIDFKRRKREHFGHIIQAVDLYMFENGRNNFSMEIFTNINTENYSNEDLQKKEQELILQYDTINNGYNKQKSGLITKDKDYKITYAKEHNETERRREYKKTYAKEHSQELKEKKKEYYKQNKQKILDYQKEYQIANKEKIKQYQKEYQKKYYQEHKVKCAHYLSQTVYTKK